MHIALFASLGILVGALVNQLGSDLPARRRLTRPHCRYCGGERPRWQWVSLPAYLTWRARCSSCGTAFGLRHLFTELGMAGAYVYLWLTNDHPVTLVLHLIYAAIFALILVTDLERRLILNVVTYPAIVLAFVASFFAPGITWWSSLIGGVVGFGFFLAAALVGNRLFGSGALGGGDVMLAAFVGLAVGWPLVIEALLLSLILGALISLVLLATRIRRLSDHIPYGPFIVAGAIITLLWGYAIAEWYLYR